MNEIYAEEYYDIDKKFIKNLTVVSVDDRSIKLKCKGKDKGFNAFIAVVNDEVCICLCEQFVKSMNNLRILNFNRVDNIVLFYNEELGLYINSYALSLQISSYTEK